jgi:hypothetical protein
MCLKSYMLQFIENNRKKYHPNQPVHDNPTQGNPTHGIPHRNPLIPIIGVILIPVIEKII